MLKWMMLLGTWTACGGDSGGTSGFEPMTGAPIFVGAFEVTATGQPVVAGQDETDNAYRLYRPKPDDETVWEAASPSFSVPFVAGTLFHAPDHTLYFGANDTLYQLATGSGFSWTSLDPPAGAIPFGADAAGTFYGRLSDGSLGHWRTGESAWTVLPGSDGGDVHDWHVVDAAGTVFATSLTGIQRYTAQGATLAFDCNTDAFFNCNAGSSYPTLDAAGNLYFAVSPLTVPARYAYRVKAGATVAERLAELPPASPFCRGLQALPDGTLILDSTLDNLLNSERVVSRLNVGAAVFDGLAVSFPGMAHFASDRSTIYAWGNGHGNNGESMPGVYRGRF